MDQAASNTAHAAIAHAREQIADARAIDATQSGGANEARFSRAFELLGELADCLGVSDDTHAPAGAGERGSSTCPKCGATPEYHIESVEQRRTVLGLDGDVLMIEGLSEVLDEGAENERLHCSACDHEWPLPAQVDYR